MSTKPLEVEIEVAPEQLRDAVEAVKDCRILYDCAVINWWEYCSFLKTVRVNRLGLSEEPKGGFRNETVTSQPR